MSILELKDVRYTYRTQYQQVQALKGISCSFEEGKLYAIMGKSGSGKTTLLSLMAGLDLPSEGEVLCQGVSTARMDLERYRREQAAVIYQSFRLFPLLTVAENVMFPMELRGVKPRAARARAAELIRRVSLPEAVLDRYPTMLSGGEQQRVAIARALGMETKLLFADEPTRTAIASSWSPTTRASAAGRTSSSIWWTDCSRPAGRRGSEPLSPAQKSRAGWRSMAVKKGVLR